MEIRTVLFDFGHTLFDVAEPGELVAQTAAAAGISIESAEALRLWESIAAEAMTPEEMARQRDISREAHRSNWVRLLTPLESIGNGLAEAVYESLLTPENWEAYADCGTTLRALKAHGVSIGIVSDIGFDLRPLFSHHFAEEKLVDHFVLSYEHGSVKPDPLLFEAALGALGADPAQTLMVGDNPITDGGAAALGISVLILPTAPRAGIRGLGAVLDLVGIPAASGTQSTTQLTGTHR